MMEKIENFQLLVATVSGVARSSCDVNLTIALPQCVWGLSDEWTNSVDLRTKFVLNSICTHIE